MRFLYEVRAPTQNILRGHLSRKKFTSLTREIRKKLFCFKLRFRWRDISLKIYSKGPVLKEHRNPQTDELI
jgi:hypothetical protein